jgi:hypothetical protein
LQYHIYILIKTTKREKKLNHNFTLQRQQLLQFEATVRVRAKVQHLRLSPAFLVVLLLHLAPSAHCCGVRCAAPAPYEQLPPLQPTPLSRRHASQEQLH